MMNTVTAPAISRIISTSTGLDRARKSGWSTGYYVVGLGKARVEVGYQDTNPAATENALTEICDAINGREDQKYLAKLETTRNGSSMVVVTPRPESKEDHMEKLAEESPYAVTKREVNKVLEGPCYPYTEGAAGYVIERAEAPNDRLVRVTYRDHAHTMYALVIGGREQYVKGSVKFYADKLRAAGFSVAIEGDYESVLVGVPDEFPSEDDPQEVKEALNALREAVEDYSPSYLTRRAGNQSLFVVYQSPDGQTRRVEVSWAGGAYRSRGWLSQGSYSEFHNTDLAVKFIQSELRG